MDALVGGLPRGAMTEICGTACSGRTSLLLSALASRTAQGEVCALLDARDSFDPLTADAAGGAPRKYVLVRSPNIWQAPPRYALRVLPRASGGRWGGRGWKVRWDHEWATFAWLPRQKWVCGLRGARVGGEGLRLGRFGDLDGGYERWLEACATWDSDWVRLWDLLAFILRIFWCRRWWGGTGRLAAGRLGWRAGRRRGGARGPGTRAPAKREIKSRIAKATGRCL